MNEATERYERFSYQDIADLQGAFDMLAGVLSSMKADGGRNTAEYADLLDALYNVGNSISYGEDAYNELQGGGC